MTKETLQQQMEEAIEDCIDLGEYEVNSIDYKKGAESCTTIAQSYADKQSVAFAEWAISNYIPVKALTQLRWVKQLGSEEYLTVEELLEIFKKEQSNGKGV